ncbi:MAG TPA: GNAT family N-acetyltransferase [Candidatus Pseudogracilibacillus intestinigallinarum]|uniref:GNAT family N-acetyltransferase n=1 Tax=Candidatus Pseudogracilibacillus intestinigallinarum TaxID=2838742 RepID=A0A9D1PQN1_9BACI|nr:GNAT family N-acetyltransferase [Candidatus Pseudogracilibacillus intestinigallinarum]
MEIFIVQNEQQLQDAYTIRKKVFVEEQNVPLSIELDEHDEHATHFICYDSSNKPVGASRLRFIDNYGKLERICVDKGLRGKSIGKKIIEIMEVEIIHQGYHEAVLNAQTHATTFYEKLGYEVISDEFIDAGIPHVTMKKTL